MLNIIHVEFENHSLDGGLGVLTKYLPTPTLDKPLEIFYLGFSTSKSKPQPLNPDQRVTESLIRTFLGQTQWRMIL